MARTLTVVLGLGLAATAAGCAWRDGPPAPEAPRAASTTSGRGASAASPRLPGPVATATDLDWVQTERVLDGDVAVGYVDRVLPVPIGIADQRGYTPGTILVRDVDMALLGFVTPNGASYRFTDDDRSRPVGGTPDAAIATILGRAGDDLEYEPLTP